MFGPNTIVRLIGLTAGRGDFSKGHHELMSPFSGGGDFEERGQPTAVRRHEHVQARGVRGILRLFEEAGLGQQIERSRPIWLRS